VIFAICPTFKAICAIEAARAAEQGRGLFTWRWLEDGIEIGL
jgi:hypothetical protein